MPEVLTETNSTGALSGRELDIAVAERVMGWQRQPDYNYWMSFPAGESFKLHKLIATWRPCESIEAAMDVVNRMKDLGYMWNAQTPHGTGWEVQCYQPTSRGRGEEVKGLLPEAICRAALKALGAQ